MSDTFQGTLEVLSWFFSKAAKANQELAGEEEAGVKHRSRVSRLKRWESSINRES